MEYLHSDICNPYTGEKFYMLNSQVKVNTITVFTNVIQRVIDSTSRCLVRCASILQVQIKIFYKQASL